MRHTIALATFALLTWAGNLPMSSTAAEPDGSVAQPTLPGFDALPSHPELPDPLVSFSGEPVRTAEAWRDQRRPELARLFQHYMYGYFPPVPQTTWELTSEDVRALDGKATLKQFEIDLGPPKCPKIHLLVVVPNERPQNRPAPVFVALNFTGNHTVLDHPGITLPTAWMPDAPGVDQHRATAAGRGKAASSWELAHTIERGYALATFYYGDVLPDKTDFQDGIFPYFRQQTSAERGPHEWGAIAMWGWGLQRAVDCIIKQPELDARRIIAFGHSRNGKAALVAAAFDQRIAAVIPHQAGCGGTAPSRRKNPKGEPVSRINQAFPHWFDETFHKFGDHEDKLPFDQHCLIAMCAPRAVLLTNGDQDQWADPPGQFEMLRAATPVYRLLGRQGLPDDVTAPVDGKLLGAELSYSVRHIGHLVDRQYWDIFMDFADRTLPVQQQ